MGNKRRFRELRARSIDDSFTCQIHLLDENGKPLALTAQDSKKDFQDGSTRAMSLRDTLEFDKELHSLYETKLPVSASKISSLTKLAIKHAKVWIVSSRAGSVGPQWLTDLLSFYSFSYTKI